MSANNLGSFVPTDKSSSPDLARLFLHAHYTRALRPQELEETTKFTDATAYLPDATVAQRGSNRRSGGGCRGWLAWCCYRPQPRGKGCDGGSADRGNRSKAPADTGGEFDAKLADLLKRHSELELGSARTPRI